MRLIFVSLIGLCAVALDFRDGRIPNPLIAAGLLLGAAWQWCANGPPGLLSFALGALLPPVVLSIPHAFRMLGAGDVKYYMVLGGFLGPGICLYCIWFSLVLAALWASALLIRKHILFHRLNGFVQYLNCYRKTGIWRPYITERNQAGYLNLSLPIFLGSLFVIIWMDCQIG